MGNEEIKKANRKALPKFILLCIVGALIGGVAGYLVGANGIDTMSGDFKVVVSNYVELTAPWIMLAIAVIIPIVLVHTTGRLRSSYHSGMVKTKKYQMVSKRSFL